MSGLPEDRDLLAAEFVLGTLERHDARAVELMAETDHELAAAIVAWQNRLAPLGRVVPQQAPPRELWARLEESTAPVVLQFPPAKPRAVARAWRSPGVWRGTTAGALALAAAFAGLAFLRAPPEPGARPVFMAELAPIPPAAPVTAEASARPAPPLAQSAASSSAEHATVQQNAAQPAIAGAKPDGFEQSAAAPAQVTTGAGSSLEPAQQAAGEIAPGAPAPSAGFVVASVSDRAVMVEPVGQVRVPAGKELELWELPPGATHPKALGALGPTGTRVAMPEPGQANTKLMVSLEPAGSAPTAPTGRVLYSGTLTPLR